jgi:serine/threonine-protein kinase
MGTTHLAILVAVGACANPDPSSDASDPGMPPGLDAGAPILVGSGDAAVGTTPGAGPYFAHPMFFNREVSTAPAAATSAATIAALTAAGGWGTGRMQIDFALDVLAADPSAPMRSFTPTADFFSPDCDRTQLPVPVGGNVEDEPGYACTGGGDCHLIVFDTATTKLYEMWRADITSTFQGGCLAVWDGQAAYGDALRGDQCTSADAAGFPIAPLLFTADEVAAGHIDHAIRFVLPNNRVAHGFTRPATHGTSTTGGAGAPAYGVHLRLRADYPIASLPTAGAQVVARAMQRYGMYHADGGNIALTAQSDRHTTAKWAGLLGPLDLSQLEVRDFEVIDHGSPIALTDNCTR